MKTRLTLAPQPPVTPRPGGSLRRVVVVGTSGAGKTTVARALARHLALPHVELDALRHGPGWTETPEPLFREQVAAALAGDAWVVDGNYGMVRDLVWRRADTLVWLDYSLPVVMGRVCWRTARRIVTRQELWNGNRESLRMALSRDSILLWALTTYHRRRRQYPALLRQPAHRHLAVLRHRRPAETRRWLASLVGCAGYA